MKDDDEATKWAVLSDDYLLGKTQPINRSVLENRETQKSENSHF
jgi:hypothetical protein